MQFFLPHMLWWIIPVFFFLLLFLRIDFVKLSKEILENKNLLRKRRRFRILVFISRFLILSLIIIALAEPYAEIITSSEGEPKIQIIVDNSSSMDLYDTSFVSDLVENIQKKVPIKVDAVNTRMQSDVSGTMLSVLEEDTHVLLVSDGNNNGDVDLADASLFATSINASVSAIELTPKGNDASVSIKGPSKVIEGVEAQFRIDIHKVNVPEYTIKITLDDEVIMNKKENNDFVTFTRTFDSLGSHKLTAEIIVNDQNPINNKFYKAIQVVEKPKILYVGTKPNPIEKILDELYEVDRTQIIPSDLSPYYAVIMDNLPISKISKVDEIADFVSDGNGLLVIGGFNSFDRGGYKESYFETLLPVYVGAGEKKQGDANIVMLIDVSGTTGNIWTKVDGKLVEIENDALDVQKALVVDLVETLNVGNKVGAVVFAIPDKNNPGGSMKAVKVQDIQPLHSVKHELIDKLSRIDAAGQSLFDLGFKGAYSLIKGRSGSKNILLVSDGGKNVYPPIKEEAKRLVELMASRGITTYTVGVGRNVDEEYLQDLAFLGHGAYFPASKKNRLKALFGDPEEKSVGDEIKIFMLNSNHFITRVFEDEDIDATMFGYNQVKPKSLAKQLLIADNGIPAVTTWRYGVGRVTAITVFSGDHLGQLLNEQNSALLSRIINWDIGDPERKKAYTISIGDTRENKTGKVTIKSEQIPDAEGLDFIKTNENSYEALFLPSTIGFGTILNTHYAVNYPEEYEEIGIHEGLGDIVESTGGKIFKSTEHDEIVEFVKTLSRRTRHERTVIMWPFLLAALFIFFIEVSIRRLRSYSA